MTMTNTTSDYDDFSPQEPSDMSDLARQWSESHFKPSPEKNSNFVSQLNIDSRYVSVYFGFSKSYKLKPVEAMLAALVESLSRAEGTTCFMGKEKMAGLLNVSPPTIFHALTVLRKKEIIEKFTSSKNFRGWRLTGPASDKLQYCWKMVDQAYKERNKKTAK